MTASKEEVPLKPLDSEQGKNLYPLLDHPENPSQSSHCCKMECKQKVIAAFFACAIGIGAVFGLVFGVDWSGGPTDATDPTVRPPTGVTIEGSASNFFKTQDTAIGDDYFKFVPSMKDGNPITYKQFLNMIRTNQNFLNDFVEVLKTGTAFGQYYFECKPIKKSTFETQAFEFVLKKADDLANRTPDYAVFENDLENCQGGSIDFTYGLNGDSTLISPCVPKDNNDLQKYTHLAIFVKEAPKSTVDSVFKKAAQVMTDKVSQSSNAEQKWFLSTDGSGGAAWLHVRINKRARYYSFDEYRFE